jgi:hypothetical protein
MISRMQNPIFKESGKCTFCTYGILAPHPPLPAENTDIKKIREKFPHDKKFGRDSRWKAI